MNRKITEEQKSAAVQEYLVDTKSTLRSVAMNHGICQETLRRILGSRVRHKHTMKKRVIVENTGNIPITTSRRDRKAKVVVDAPNAYERWPEHDDEILREGIKNNVTSKELGKILGRSRRAILCRKHILLNEGFIKDSKRFYVPSRKGIKYDRKDPNSRFHIEQLQLALQEKEKEIKGKTGKKVFPIEVTVKEVKKVKPVQKSNGEQIQAIKLDYLAAIVNKHGVSVKISTNKEGMEITINK